MSDPKLTPWFKGGVKPVRDGVYERDYGGRPYFLCLFKDGEWMCYGDDVADAISVREPSMFQSEPWRGLASDPSKRG